MESNYSEKMKKFQDYMDALEEERNKMQVFHRELPLSLDLINQAICNCRQQLESSTTGTSMDSEEQTTSSDGGSPILEEFIPLNSSICSSHFEKLLQKSSPPEIEVSKNKLDWLKSVQLWNQNPDPVLKEDSSLRKATLPALESKESSDQRASLAFPRHKTNQTVVATPTSTPGSRTTSSTTETINDSDANYNKNPKRSKEDEEEDHENERERPQGQSSSSSLRKTRRYWSPELHRRFLSALQQLGGSQVATPKQIRELMKVDGLTNDEVKSHLQKYRLHTRRPSPVHNSVNSQPPQFVVVGGIWVPPPKSLAGESTAQVTSNNRIYAPIAAIPHQLGSSSFLPQPNHKNLHFQMNRLRSDGRNSREQEHTIGYKNDHDDNVHLISPSISSSTTCTSTPSLPL
ncbi:hypothetical protein C5167_033769 [Papaver somniferum]|uniref:HTH myb-type domain-containing protein n=1 Tax=Papaver somniferum TaxID=3469 RepID=A0A4Y7KE33_PAPSO|nr:transcription factor HHO2-like [Papaver somniferum]RZC70610.1 hypothetical protein C5167_033769 [Papaver somniferum]